ncbi:hypothetical protein IWQ61_004248 [Dispira simplex]|nr:hypothetical protein IWQ61_004248 [Dispira simplex]
MAHAESAEAFLPQFAAPKSTTPTSSFRQALSQLQVSDLITSTTPSWRSQRQAPRSSTSLFQVYQAQTLINHRRLNKVLPVGVVLSPGTPWSLGRQLLDWSLA